MQDSLSQNRLGFHYYPDTIHYREEDLKLLLPRLNSLEAGWITLLSHPERAIPEFFLKALIDHEITPIIHIPMPIRSFSNLNNLSVLFKAYASWGIKYLALFDRPNLKKAWEPSTWSQKDLVERFLDFYLPLAEAAVVEGLVPVFPPLEPGGDFWDTVFLLSALSGIVRRAKQMLVESLTLSAYAWTYGHDIFWGRGGQSQWPSTQPYFTPLNNQDQIGFNIFDWYLQVSSSVMGRELPIILLAAGCRKEDCTSEKDPVVRSDIQDQTNLNLYNLVRRSQIENHVLPKSVIACNFWLLSATESQPEAVDAWFPDKGQPKFVVSRIFEQYQNLPRSDMDNTPLAKEGNKFSIGHYLLLPETSCQSKDWIYQTVNSLYMSRNPLSIPRFFEWGSSLPDALNSKRVTVIGSTRWLDESHFSELASVGCVIEEIYGDGTLIASRLLNL